MKNILSFIVVAILLIACEKDVLTANGNIITETRTPGTFTGVHTSGSNSIHIKFGNEYKVEIKGSSNIIPYYESKIIGDKLHLDFQHINIKKNDLEVFVTMPTVNNISNSGSAKIDINGNFPAIDNLSFTTSGSGGVITNANLTATNLNVNISGSSVVDIKNITANKVNASLSGSGSTYVTVQEKLTAHISGSGNVYYMGSPLIESHISATGKVIKL
jgi:hypothetical protein